MFKAIGFGLAAGAAFQAWRNLPGDGPASTWPATVLLFVALGVGWFAGKTRRHHSAQAFAAARAEASSTATAQQQVNVAVVVPGAGAGSAGAAHVPSEAAPWLGGSRPMLTLDDLDGMDVAELMQETSTDEQDA